MNRFLNSSLERVRVFVHNYLVLSIDVMVFEISYMYVCIAHILFFLFWRPTCGYYYISRCLRVWPDSLMYLKLHFVQLFKYALFFESCILIFGLRPHKFFSIVFLCHTPLWCLPFAFLSSLFLKNLVCMGDWLPYQSLFGSMVFS